MCYSIVVQTRGGTLDKIHVLLHSCADKGVEPAWTRFMYYVDGILDKIHA